MFRSAAIGDANVIDDLSAMANVFKLRLENVVGDSLRFLNVDAAVLMSDFISFMTADKVIFEILETVKVTPDI